jgi:RimJ/RimL family protein N-acetyltransferase
MKYLMNGAESERLKFRLLEESDYETWRGFFEEERVATFIALGHLKTVDEKLRAFFDRGLQRYADGLGGVNVLVAKVTGEVVGTCGLLIQTVDGVTKMEVGYTLLPQHRGKGYALEAARKCRDYAFENNFTDDLLSIIHVDNEKSKQVARGNGMRSWLVTEYKNMPVEIFRITQDEWRDATR